MNKKLLIIYCLLLLLFPIGVFASSNTLSPFETLPMSIIFISVFHGVIICETFRMFKIAHIAFPFFVIARILFLAIIYTNFEEPVFVDFFSTFFFTFGFAIIQSAMTYRERLKYRCPRCGEELDYNDGFMKNCVNCGCNIKTAENFMLCGNKIADVITNTSINPIRTPEKGMIPRKLYQRKIFKFLMFSTLLFVSISSIFYHFRLIVYFLILITLLLSFIYAIRNDLKKFIVKEVTDRKKERIYEIIDEINNSHIQDRSLLFIITFILVALVLPFCLHMEPRIIYTYNDTYKGYEVSYFIGGLDNTKIEIPDTYNGVDVLIIGNNAFANTRTVKEVVLPKNLKIIEINAFARSSIEKINIPNSVTHIKEYAFIGCSKLSEVTITSKTELMYIGMGAFRNCPSLRRIYLTEFEHLNESAFDDSTTIIINDFKE